MATTKSKSTKKANTKSSNKSSTSKAKPKETKETKKTEPKAPKKEGMGLSALGQTLSDLTKSYMSIEEPDFIKTGSVVMDALLGGGVPRGSFILWSSHSGIGKSTGSLFISRGFVAQGLKVLYLDFEGGLNRNQLEGIGLIPYLYDAKTNPEGSFICFRVQSYKDAETFLDKLLGEVDLVVIDSITSVLPDKMREKSVEDIQPGLQARLMTNLLLKYKTESVKSGTSWIMINQMRTHIRFVGQTTDEEAGGNALKFFSDYRIMMKEAYKGKLEREESTPKGIIKVPFGSLNEIWCVKSRFSRPFIPLTLGVVFGKGIYNDYAYYDFLKYQGCILKEGSWYTVKVLDRSAKVQGENKVVNWIAENRDFIREFIASNGGYRMLMDTKDSLGEEYAHIIQDEEEQGEEEASIMMGTIDYSVRD